MVPELDRIDNLVEVAADLPHQLLILTVLFQKSFDLTCRIAFLSVKSAKKSSEMCVYYQLDSLRSKMNRPTCNRLLQVVSGERKKDGRKRFI